MGIVVAVEHGVVKVDYPGNRAGPLVARIAAPLEDAALSRAARERQEALLSFDYGHPGRPISSPPTCSAR